LRGAFDRRSARKAKGVDGARESTRYRGFGRACRTVGAELPGWIAASHRLVHRLGDGRRGARRCLVEPAPRIRTPVVA